MGLSTEAEKVMAQMFTVGNGNRFLWFRLKIHQRSRVDTILVLFAAFGMPLAMSISITVFRKNLK